MVFLRFRRPDNMGIHVPLGAGISGRITTEAAMTGNLPALFSPPIAHVLTTAKPYESGGAPATAATLLNDLDDNVTDYTTGDILQIEGTNADGSPITAQLNVDATTTIGDIVNMYNSLLIGATASLDAEGNITVNVDESGESPIALRIYDDPANTGSTELANHVFLTTTEGSFGDTAESTMQVFDLRGEAHILNVEYQKQDSNSWDVTFSLADDSGEITSGSVFRIEFSEDGQFQTVQGTGARRSDPGTEV
jgi:hypothetical protein